MENEEFCPWNSLPTGGRTIRPIYAIRPLVDYELKSCPHGCVFHYGVTDLFNKNYHKCKHTHPQDFLAQNKDQTSKLTETIPSEVTTEQISQENRLLFSSFITYSNAVIDLLKAQDQLRSHRPNRNPTSDVTRSDYMVPDLNDPRLNSEPIYDEDFIRSAPVLPVYKEALRRGEPIFKEDFRRGEPLFMEDPRRGENSATTTINFDAYRQEALQIFSVENKLDSSQRQGGSVGAVSSTSLAALDQHLSIFGAPGFLQRPPAYNMPPTQQFQDSQSLSTKNGESSIEFTPNQGNVWHSTPIPRATTIDESGSGQQSWNLMSSSGQQTAQDSIANSFQDLTMKPFCAFCKSSGKPENIYTSHIMKDYDNKNLCPYLRKIICPLCHCTDPDTAHTLKYCPRYREHMLDEACSQRKKK